MHGKKHFLGQRENTLESKISAEKNKPTKSPGRLKAEAESQKNNNSIPNLSQADRLLFLKYAVPCATTLVKRNSISQKEYDELYSKAKSGVVPGGEPEKIFKVAYAKCLASAMEKGSGINKEIIRDYFWLGHDAVIEERFELMKDFDPVHCKTFPGVVLDASAGMAKVKTSIGQLDASADFEPSAKKGDFVVVHRGIIVEKISETEAMEFARATGKKFR